MVKVGDKVVVLPFDELDKKECEVYGKSVYGIGNEFYDEYIGKEYTINLILMDEESKIPSCQLLEDENLLYFPIGCLKKL